MFMKHYAPNRCETSIEAIVKMAFRPGWGRGVWLVARIGLEVGGKCKKRGVRGMGQSGCEPRIELIVVRVVVNCIVKMKNKIVGGGGGWI